MLEICSCVSPIWSSDVQQTQLPLGVITPRLFDRCYDAISVYILQIREENPSYKQICNIMNV